MTQGLDGFLNTLNDRLSFPTEIAVIGMAIVYTALVIVVRWQMIARPMRNGIEARLALLEADAHRLGEEHKRIAEAVLEIAKNARKGNTWHGVQEAIFWSRGKETALFQLIDKAESYLTYTWTRDKLVVRLATVNARLQELADPTARELSRRIVARLKEVEAARHRPSVPLANLDELCELHREGVRLSRESLVEGDVESDYFNNKILWHIMVSLAALVFVANIGPTVAGHLFYIPSLWSVYSNGIRPAFISLLLAGAVGGILSRLTRALRSGASPAERGLSWMAMFLSPLVGALAGWAGGMLLLTGHELRIVIPMVPDETLWLVLMSVGVLFGFSERMFTGLAEKLEKNILLEQRSVQAPHPVPMEALPAEHAAGAASVDASPVGARSET